MPNLLYHFTLREKKKTADSWHVGAGCGKKRKEVRPRRDGKGKGRRDDPLPKRKKGKGFSFTRTWTLNSVPDAVASEDEERPPVC